MNKRQLERFVRIRNKSPFHNNLQFQIDLSEAGLKVADLGEIKAREEGGYEWRTRFGLLIEDHEGMRIEGCEHCANEAEPGRIETDNNGPIVDCPHCRPATE